MRIVKAVPRERQVDAVRRHATALLDAAGIEIENVSGLRIRHASFGRFAIVETGPITWSIRPKHWSLNVFDQGLRVYTAQWHAPDEHDCFTDGMDCLLMSPRPHDWYPSFLRLALSREGV